MFVEVVIVEERRHAEALADALIEAGALAASIEDADAGSLDEQPLYGEPGMAHAASAWNRSRIVALFDDSTAIEAVLRAAFGAVGIADVPAFERREVADENWVALTQSQFDPIAIGDRLWIVPSWHEPPVGAQGSAAIVLRLDPGMAFGTGDHPTTRMCLAWLERNVLSGASVVDYGCGSGILAIAAKKLGAGHVTGTDIDEQAVAAARANALANAVDIDFSSSAGFTTRPAQIVVANILSNPLKVLAPLLTSLVASGGQLVLSGILERQWKEVAAVYAPLMTLDLWRAEDGWVCLAGRRTGDDGKRA